MHVRNLCLCPGCIAQIVVRDDQAQTFAGVAPARLERLDCMQGARIPRQVVRVGDGIVKRSRGTL